MKNKQLKNVKLTKEQTSTIKEMIIDSFKCSSLAADKIIKNTQMALIQNTVYAKAVKDSKPLKIVKKKR